MFLDKRPGVFVTQLRAAVEVQDVQLSPVIDGRVDDEDGCVDIRVGVFGKEALPFLGAFSKKAIFIQAPFEMKDTIVLIICVNTTKFSICICFILGSS